MTTAKKILRIATVCSTLLLPVAVYAAPDLKGLIQRFVDVIVIMIPVASGIALLVFFYGLTKYIFNQSNANEKESSKQIIVWGLVGLFVLFSIYGIVNVFKGTLFRYSMYDDPLQLPDPFEH